MHTHSHRNSMVHCSPAYPTLNALLRTCTVSLLSVSAISCHTKAIYRTCPVS